jgi:hypothetical protein
VLLALYSPARKNSSVKRQINPMRFRLIFHSLLR